MGFMESNCLGTGSDIYIIFSYKFPDDWIVVIIVPLFKKGCRDRLGTYMLVSLTSVVGSLLQRILRDRIYLHLERHGLIRDSQHCLYVGNRVL